MTDQLVADDKDLSPEEVAARTRKVCAVPAIISGTPKEVYVVRKPRKVMDVASAELPVRSWREVLVLHVGAAYIVQAPEYPTDAVTSICRGGSMPAGRGRRTVYDGSSDAVISMGRYHFTYEYLQSFLHLIMHASTTFRGYLRHSLSTYLFAAGASADNAQLRELVTAELSNLEKAYTDDPEHSGFGTHKLYKAFVGAVFDYIQLQVSDLLTASEDR